MRRYQPSAVFACADSAVYVALALGAQACVPAGARDSSFSWLVITMSGQLIIPAWYAPGASSVLLSLASPLAWSRGTENMVITTGHYGGDVVFSGHGAGGQPTAVAVVSDLVGLAQGSCRIAIPSTPAKVSTELEVPHYIRFLVNDRQPGLLFIEWFHHEERRVQ